MAQRDAARGSGGVGGESAARQAAALVRLLADDAPGVRETVRERLFEGGETARLALGAAARGDDPLLRARARQLLGEMGREAGYRDLEARLGSGTCSLEAGLGAIDRILGVPDPEVAPAFEAFAGRVRARCEGNDDPGSAARALHSVLVEEEGFGGVEDDYHNLDHVSLVRALRSRRGLPLTLSALYAGVARRAGLRAGLLPFPAHVLLGLGPTERQVILDPFDGGRTVSSEECRARLAELGAPDSARWVTRTDDRTMVIRQVRNLRAAMRRHGRLHDARRIRRILDAAVR